MIKSEIEILSIFPYGSINYGTHTEKSDLDFIYVVPDESPILYDFQYHDTKTNADYTIYKETSFISHLKEHKVDALECIFGTNMLPVRDYKRFFELDLTKLRESISSVCSNSWVKAKKKFLIEKDYDVYKGKKSLFHSIRIYDFGCQIAEYGKIVDFESCKDLWFEIYNDTSEDYEHYKEKYKPLYNSYHSKFVKLAPKKC